MNVRTYRSRDGAHWRQPAWPLGDGNAVVHCLRAAAYVALLPVVAVLLLLPLAVEFLAARRRS